jgi:hypothetical protein
LPTMVKAVTLARAEEIRMRGVLSSSTTILATTTGSTTSTPAPATPSTPTSAGPVTQGGTAAALLCRYCKSKTHEIEQCRRRPSHRKGGQVPLPVRVVLLLSSLRSGSLSSPDGLIVWSVVPCLSIHPWFLLPPLSLLSFHSQVLSHLGSLILELLFT